MWILGFAPLMQFGPEQVQVLYLGVAWRQKEVLRIKPALRPGLADQAMEQISEIV